MIQKDKHPWGTVSKDQVLADIFYFLNKGTKFQPLPYIRGWYPADSHGTNYC